MNRYAKIVVCVLLIGIALMVFGEAWNMQASMRNTEAIGDEISAISKGEKSDLVNAQLDEYAAQDRMSWVVVVYGFGMIVAVLGVVVLVMGMIAPEPAVPQQFHEESHPATVPPPEHELEQLKQLEQ